jgi:hypothetical protein
MSHRKKVAVTSTEKVMSVMTKSSIVMLPTTKAALWNTKDNGIKIAGTNKDRNSHFKDISK